MRANRPHCGDAADGRVDEGVGFGTLCARAIQDIFGRGVMGHDLSEGERPGHEPKCSLPLAQGMPGDGVGA